MLDSKKVEELIRKRFATLDPIILNQLVVDVWAMLAVEIDKAREEASKSLRAELNTLEKDRVVARSELQRIRDESEKAKAGLQRIRDESEKANVKIVEELAKAGEEMSRQLHELDEELAQAREAKFVEFSGFTVDIDNTMSAKLKECGECDDDIARAKVELQRIKDESDKARADAKKEKLGELDEEIAKIRTAKLVEIRTAKFQELDMLEAELSKAKAELQKTKEELQMTKKEKQELEDESLPPTTMAERFWAWFHAHKGMISVVLTVGIVLCIMAGFMHHWSNIHKFAPAPTVDVVPAPAPATAPAPESVPTASMSKTTAEPTPAPAHEPESAPAENPKIVKDCLAGDEAQAYACCTRLPISEQTICRQTVSELIR